MDQNRDWVEPAVERIGRVEDARNASNVVGQNDGSQDYSSTPAG